MRCKNCHRIMANETYKTKTGCVWCDTSYYKNRSDRPLEWFYKRIGKIVSFRAELDLIDNLVIIADKEYAERYCTAQTYGVVFNDQ